MVPHQTLAVELPGTLCLYAVEDCPTLCRHSATAAVWARGSTSQIAVAFESVEPWNAMDLDINAETLAVPAEVSAGLAVPLTVLFQTFIFSLGQQYQQSLCSQHISTFQHVPTFSNVKAEKISKLPVVGRTPGLQQQPQWTELTKTSGAWLKNQL